MAGKGWGGKRKGAGRPNRKLLSLGVDIRGKTWVQLEEELGITLGDHPERKIAVAKLVAEGFTTEAIMERMPGVNIRTMQGWPKQAWWAPLLSKFIDELSLLPKDAFVSRLSMALSVLDRHLEDGSLKAAQTVFDEIYGKSVIRVQSRGVQRVEWVIRNEAGLIVEVEGRVLDGPD